MRALLLVVLAVLAVPVVAAQHEHMDGSTGMAMVLHDGPDDGRAVAGAFTHFGFALLDPKGVPTVHQNAGFLVTLDNVTTFQTHDTHEYDGLFSLDVVFAHPGHYRVEATSGKMATGVFEGDVVAPVADTVAKVVWKAAPTAPQSNAVTGTLDIVGPDGKEIPHTDALLEWREAGSGALAARYHMHIHTAPIQLTQGFDKPGDYVLHVTAYQAFATGKGADVRPVVADFAFTAGAIAVPAVADLRGVPVPPDMTPAGAVASADGSTLYGMYDPQDQVAMGFPIRLSGLIEGNDSMPKPHVNFEFTAVGPRGTLFQSKSLHEYDGHFEWEYVPQAPGAYDATLTAVVGSTRLSVPFHVQVIPPVAPLGLAAGPGASFAEGVVDVQGLDKAVAGQPTELTFRVMGPTGAIQHSEVDVTLSKKGEPAAFAFKLHTHESGITHAVLAFPSEGDWTLQVDPTPTDTGPVVFHGPDGPGMPIVFHAKVAPPAGIAAAAVQGVPAGKSVPGLPVPLALVGISALVLLRRRG